MSGGARNQRKKSASPGESVLARWRRVRGAPARRRPQYVLDVRILSRKEVRIRRAERTKVALKIGAVLLLGIGTIAGAKSVVSQALSHGSEVMLRRIEVRTNGRLSREELIAVSGLREGQNILRVDLADVKSRLLGLPQVQDAAVDRELPDRVTIAVRERIPLAWIECRQQGVLPQSSRNGYLLDVDGELFACQSLTPDLLVLPLIRIEGAVRVEEGVRLDSDGVDAAIDLLKGVAAYLPRGGWDIVRIRIEHDLVLRVGFRNGVAASFWCHELSRQLSDMQEIVAYAEAEGRPLEWLDLRMKNNIPVRFHDPGREAAEADGELAESEAFEDLPSAIPVHDVRSLAGEPADDDPGARRQSQIRRIIKGY